MSHPLFRQGGAHPSFGPVPHRPHDSRQQGSVSGYVQKPRTVTHSEIFFMRMPVLFTGTAAEVTPAFTKQEGFDALVKAGWTDLAAAKVRFVERETATEWSSTQIHVRGQLGNSNEVKPLMPFGNPILLQAMSQIRGDWLNAGSEPAGTAIFYCEKIADERTQGDGQIIVLVSRSYWIEFDLSNTSLIALSDQVNSDILIWGATTNCDNSIIGQVTNISSNYAWSSDQIPIRSMAGVDGQVEPRMYYPRPYLLPANVQLRVTYNAAVAGQYLQLLCERIYH